MSCDSSYQDPNHFEIEYSRVLTLIHEVKHGHFVKNNWNGFHSMAYGKKITKKQIDTATAKLCQLLKQETDLKKYSLELQMWWRDHQRYDQEKEQSKKDITKQNLLDFLSNIEDNNSFTKHQLKCVDALRHMLVDTPDEKYGKTMIFSRKPVEMHLENGLLHNESGPSIRFADGFSVWSIHGYRVTEQIVMHPETLTMDQIDSEENVDIKKIMLQRMNKSTIEASCKND